MRWLELSTAPDQAFYRHHDTPFTADLSYPLYVDHTPIHRSSEDGEEAGNTTVTLNNPGGVLSHLWRDRPPMHMTATLYEYAGGATRVIFTGEVARIEHGQDRSEITVEA